MEALEYNTALAKLLKQLKKDLGATAVRQNYRGTGSQKFRRQLYVTFTEFTIDLWLDANSVGLGGVMTRLGRLTKTDRTPEQMYEAVRAALETALTELRGRVAA